jgi:hypothetical protein
MLGRKKLLKGMLKTRLKKGEVKDLWKNRQRRRNEKHRK